MPGPTTNDFIVTAYVNQNYSGSYETRSSGGYTYREYDNARGTFWFDNDQDGWFEYGRRDDGNGQWSTFTGFYWDDVPPPPPRFPTEDQEELDPNGNISPIDELLLLDDRTGSTAGFLGNEFDLHVGYQDFNQASVPFAEDGWLL